LAATDSKVALEDMLQDFYREQIKTEALETSGFNIIIQYYINNLGFAQSLKLPGEKVALLLNLFGSLLNVTPNACPVLESFEQFENYKATVKTTKYALFKSLLSPYIKESPPASLKIFSVEEIDNLLKYFTSSYLENAYLYEIVLSRKQPSFLKKIDIVIDIPNIPGSLNDSTFKGVVTGGQTELLKEKVPEKQVEVMAEEIPQKKEEQKKKTLEDKMTDLSIDQPTRQMIVSKIDEFKNSIDKMLKDREELLAKKLEDSKKAAKPKM
jgi:hypothetical protein